MSMSASFNAGVGFNTNVDTSLKLDPYDTLYSYQQRGVDYLVEKGSGCLWDDPGLGKTRQAIVAARKLGGPVLIVCPNSVKYWWREEIRKMYPQDRIMLAGTGGRFGTKKLPITLRSLLPQRGFPMWTIVHYEGVRISLDDYKAVRWSVVVLDEAHFIKNRTTKRTKAIVEVTPTLAYRIELTATPYGRNPADFWSQLRWIAPLNTALGSYWKFYEMFVDYEMDRASNGAMYRKVKGGKNLEQLARLMNGFGLRRTKKMVAPELPPITDTYMPLELEGRQATMYQKLCDTTKVEYQTANGDALSIPNTLARMTRLEQLLSHPWTFDAAVQGAKLEWVKEWAEGCSTPTVIATRFKASAHRLARELGCKSAITGDIPPILRNAILQRWLKGEEQFVVGTIDTIGTGLNLTPAHTLILYDSMYDPIRMEQTRERVHRITTDHPVEVIYLYVPGTTNEVVLRAFIERWQQIELVRRFLYYLQKGVIDDAS